MYNVDVPPALISGITNAVMEDVEERRTVRWKVPMR
jgi:hypothetical protein